MQWYYADRNERRGPVADAELAALIAAKTVTPETLVWNASMKDWQKAGTTALFGDAPPAVGKDTAVCVVTGKVFPTSQMLQTEHGWVSAEARDRYYQALTEGVPLPLAPGQTNAFADGKYVVVSQRDPRLPRRCVKTNEPVTDAEIRPRKLYWCMPWAFLSLLLSILVLVILYLVLRKKLEIEIPLSASGRSRLFRNRTIAWALFLGGFGLIIAGIAVPDWAVLILPAFCAMLASAVVGLRGGTLLRVAKWKNGQAWLTGAGRDYLASLPKYTG